MSKLSFSRNDIHVYLDGEMSPEERVRFEAWLDEHPDVAEEVRSYRELNETLRAAFDPVLAEPIPPELENLATASVSHEPFKSWPQLAAGIALTLIGSLLGWFLHDGLGGLNAEKSRFIKNALSAHSVYVPEIKHPVEVAASEQAHLQKWLSKRLGDTVRVPILKQEGYQLIGGRLLPGEEAPAAQFMYENDAGKRLTLYVTPAGQAQNTSYQFVSAARLSMYHWTDHPFHFAMIGELPHDELHRICNIVYDFLEG